MMKNLEPASFVVFQEPRACLFFCFVFALQPLRMNDGSEKDLIPFFFAIVFCSTALVNNSLQALGRKVNAKKATEQRASVQKALQEGEHGWRPPSHAP